MLFRSTVGEGSARILVRPGPQTLASPIQIHLTTPEHRRRDLNMNLWVTVQVPNQSPKVTYLDVKPIVNANCVEGCHTSANGQLPKAGLDLSEFPFKSSLHPELTQDQLVGDMVYWMRDPSDPMPPPVVAPRVPADKIAVLDHWRADGLSKFPASDQAADLAKTIDVKWSLNDSSETGNSTIERTDGDAPFHHICADLVVQGSYALDFTVHGIDGSTTYQAHVDDYVVGESGDLEKTLEIPYSTPEIDVPVVVTR